MKKSGFLLILSALCSLVFVGCTKYGAKEGGVAVYACDETFENVLQQEIDVFETLYPQHSILPYYINETACIDSLLHGDVQGAVLTRELTDQEMKFLKDKGRTVYQQQIAVDAIAVIVNPENTAEVFSIDDLCEILSGEVTNWEDVADSNNTGEIQVVFDNQGSSTVKYMRNQLLGGAKLGSNVYGEETNAEVFEIVQKNKNAIGIVGISWLASDMRHPKLDIKERVEALERNDTILLETTREDFVDGIKLVRIRKDDSLDSYLPYQQNIYDGTYPLTRPIYMVSLGVPGTTSHQFFSYVTGVKGQKLILTTGIMPARLREGQHWDIGSK